MKADLLLQDVRIVTMVGGRYGLIENAALVVHEGIIRWVGEALALPQVQARTVLAGRRRLVTPGLIDCHTHLVYGGNRAAEFEQRLLGATYEELAAAGGGIMATVKATRRTSAEALAAAARPRLRTLLREGVTTVEIKTGYGLDLETELKMVRVMEMLEEDLPVEIAKTFLGAHALPPEYRRRAEAYVDLVCDQMLPQMAERVEAVDVFCEAIAFTPAQTQRIFGRALEHGLSIRIHAEQLSNLGGALLAAGMGATSADHLEYLDGAGARAMAAAETVGVLLPGALYTLRETRRPPVDLLRRLGVPMAVATDANPGTSPCFSILTTMNMACVLLGLTPEEALAGVTVHAARALGRAGRLGTIEVDKQADLVLWDVETPAELAYYIGYNPCSQVIKRGRSLTLS